MAPNNNKVVLAFSGGLDTSFCVKYLAEKGWEIHSVTVNTGGFSEQELKDIEAKAYALGVEQHTTIDETYTYYTNCIRYMVYGNMLKNHSYPLSVSSERTFQAKAVVDHARRIGASALAHGSTGAGNDQIRFDLVAQVEAPEMAIITPIRDNTLSRQDEIDYLKERGVTVDAEESLYSINQGLWGTSVGGKETLTSHEPLPEEAYPSQLRATEPRKLELDFEKGELCGVDGQTYDDPVHAIRAVEAIGSQYAIGRGIHVGDTIIGIKGRVGFEAPAPVMIIEAHRHLEKHTLSKWQQHWKDQLSAWYTHLLHEGQYLEPVMRDIESFLDHSQRSVTGKVFLQLHPYRFDISGTESPNDLMGSGGDYGEMNLGWTGDDVRGFTKILANPMKIAHQTPKKDPTS